jgi:hypothetical protein
VNAESLHDVLADASFALDLSYLAYLSLRANRRQQLAKPAAPKPRPVSAIADGLHHINAISHRILSSESAIPKRLPRIGTGAASQDRAIALGGHAGAFRLEGGVR